MPALRGADRERRARPETGGQGDGITPIPHKYLEAANGILAQGDLRLSDSGRLRAKLLIFKTTAAMRRFWATKLPREYRSNLGRKCLGAVNGLTSWAEQINLKTGAKRLRVYWQDPRYFCLIALSEKSLSMEVVCHESSHAGCCYAKRTKNTPWRAVSEFDEEEIAYPAGRVAAAINRFLWRKKLYV